MNLTKLLTIATLIIFATQPIVAQESSTKEAQDIRAKVEQKIEEALKNPKAYIGSITDKTKDTLQIKNSGGEIQLVSVDVDATNFVQINKTTKKIKFDDIAIGDFIIAMGYRNGNEVLEAKRILSTLPIEPPKRKIVMGNIINIEKKEIATRELGGQETTFTFPKKWKGPDIKELSIGNKIIIVSTEIEGKDTIRTIHLIESPTPTAGN